MNKKPFHSPSEEPEHQTLRQKMLTKVVYAAILIIAVSGGIFLYWSFQDERILEIKNEPFPVRTIRQHPTPGGVVILDTDYCKHHDVEGEVRMSFLNLTHEVFMPIQQERSPAGCNRTEVPVLIPKTLTPGKYKIKFYVAYDLNPIKKNIRSVFESSEFEVVR